MSANLKGLLSLFFITNLTLKFAKIKPKFLSQETAGSGNCVATKVSAGQAFIFCCFSNFLRI
jgi:hypothetical protein